MDRPPQPEDQFRVLVLDLVVISGPAGEQQPARGEADAGLHGPQKAEPHQRQAADEVQERLFELARKGSIADRRGGKPAPLHDGVFQSRPRHYVTANLYLPDGLDKPHGAVLFLSGHGSLAKAAPEYQIVCQYLVHAGLIVLAQDPIGQGERYSYYDPALKIATVADCCPDHNYAGAQCEPLGDNLARYFLHDSMRALDYLCSRPEIDPNRIGVTGASGGGTQSCLMMVADPRLAAAAPATPGR